MKKVKGREYTKRAIIKLLKLGSEANLIINYIKHNTPKNSIVLLTGVGKCYPLLRSHNVLNNLHQVLDEVPSNYVLPRKIFRFRFKYLWNYSR